MQLVDIIRKLNGSIYPHGCTASDAISFEHLKTLTNVLETLVYEVLSIAKENKQTQEFSVKRSVKHVEQFSGNILEQLEELNFKLKTGE